MLLFYVIWFFALKKPESVEEEEPQTLDDIYALANKNNYITTKDVLKIYKLCENEPNNEYCSDMPKIDVDVLISEFKTAIKAADEVVEVLNKKPIDKTKLCDIFYNYEDISKDFEQDELLEAIFTSIKGYKEYGSELPGDLCPKR